jgi:hypothetical protein
MRQRWIKMVVSTCLILIGLTLFICNEIHLHAVLIALARNYASFAHRIDALATRNDDLVNEASKWRQQAKDAQKRSWRLPDRESRIAVAARARALARDILDFENEKTISQPVTILSVLPGGEEAMRRNLEDLDHYDQAATTDFLKQFGGPLDGVARKIRPYGLDTSRLQRHIETINNIVAMRLVANDLNDVADQLEPSPPERPRPAPEIRMAPDVRSTSAIGQE